MAKIPTYTFATTCNRCGGWRDLGGDADDEAGASAEIRSHRQRGTTMARVTVAAARAMTMCECRRKAARRG